MIWDQRIHRRSPGHKLYLTIMFLNPMVLIVHFWWVEELTRLAPLPPLLALKKYINWDFGKWHFRVDINYLSEYSPLLCNLSCCCLGALLTKSDVYYYCVGSSRTHLFWLYSSQRDPAHHGPQCMWWTDRVCQDKICQVPTDKVPEKNWPGWQVLIILSSSLKTNIQP